MKKLLNLMKVSAVALLAMSVQNCDELLDALGDLGPTFVLSGTVSDTSGNGIDGATVTAYGLSTNSGAVDSTTNTVDINALSGGTELTANSSGEYSGDVSLADVYVVIAEADCYSAVVEGVTDARELDQDEAISGAEGDVTLDFALGGGCGATATGSGTDATTVSAGDTTGQNIGGFEIAVNGTNSVGFVANPDTNVVELTGDFSDSFSGSADNPLLIVDLRANGSSGSYTRATQNVSVPLNMDFAVVPGMETRFALAEGDADGNITSYSDFVTVTHAGSIPDVTAILTWDGGGDVDFHAINLGDESEIYYANKTEDWGSLDLDDTNGFGPETIQVTNGAEFVKFSVYSWSCSEPVIVTVRIITSSSDQTYSFDDWATECPTTTEDRWIEIGDFNALGGR